MNLISILKKSVKRTKDVPALMDLEVNLSFGLNE